MPNELLHYLEFSNKLVADLEENECLNMRTRENIKTMSMKAQGLMEGFLNNLMVGKDKLSLLILKLEGLEASIEVTNNSWEALQKQVESQKALVNAFQTLVDDGVKEYERIRKDFERINSRLFTLEQRIIITKRN